MTFVPPQPVWHPKFGKGHVRAIRPDKTVLVAFDNGAERSVHPSFLRGATEATSAVVLPIDVARKNMPILKPTPFAFRDWSTLPTRQWIYGRHYIRKFLSVTVAPGGVGKSSLSMTEALAIATGRPLLGIKPTTTGTTWLWNGEDPKDEMDRRLAGICMHYGVTESEVGGRLYVDSGRTTEIIIAEQTRNGAVIAVPVVEALVAAIQERGIDVMIVDPFVSCHRASENDNGAIDMVAKQWARIADRTNCAIELVHHSKKTGGAETTAEDARGASALVAAARSVRLLNRMTAQEAEKAGVANPRAYFKVDVGKANLAPPAEIATWYEMRSVDIGNGPLGMGDQVGVVTSWKWPNAFDDITTADLIKAQNAVEQGKWRENAQAKNWVGIAIATALGLDLNDPAMKAKVKTLLKTWIKSGAFVIVEGEDEKRMPRQFVEVGEWAFI